MDEYKLWCKKWEQIKVELEKQVQTGGWGNSKGILNNAKIEAILSIQEHPQELAHSQNIRPRSRPASRQQNHEPRVTSDFNQSSDPLPPIRVVNCEYHDSRPTSRNGNKLAIIATPILDSEQTYYEGIPPMVCLGEVHLPVTTRNSYPEFHNLEAIRNIQ